MSQRFLTWEDTPEPFSSNEIARQKFQGCRDKNLKLFGKQYFPFSSRSRKISRYVNNTFQPFEII